MILRRLRRWFGLTGSPATLEPDAPLLELRISAGLFARVRQHVEDFARGEEAGFLVCSISQRVHKWNLVAREWHPIPESAVRRNQGYVLSWDAAINAAMIDRADELGAALVLVHSHDADPRPTLSGDDQRNAAQLFPAVTRLLPGRPSGSVVLGGEAAAGRFWLDGVRYGTLERVFVAGSPIEKWEPEAPIAPPASPSRRRLDRQTRAIGTGGEQRLSAARVAVVGCSGGGSHVCQQLAHSGIGGLLPIDDQFVEEVNLSRMVGATPSDVDQVAKVDAMKRLITSIDPEIAVESVQARFPAQNVRDAMKSADLIVTCVDSFLVREQINAFCRRHLLPLVDIGLNITTEGERLKEAAGQLVVVTPDSPCLRCTPLLSDAVLERERTRRPPGYDLNADVEGDPQVVSMNGVLAAEACNSVLDLITGYAAGARGPGWWTYDGRRGELHTSSLPSHWPACPACAELAQGDPRFSAPYADDNLVDD